ncbi:MAG TPA: sulfide/dihydroorotate dehydrogenase-like FAD/NAD-binding protein [Bryobacterales bacterium]|nr:sulfide/dihydroorotate dehydrogenase-like FAD/NAD-binding protein [Bryobacterales bacterium]
MNRILQKEWLTPQVARLRVEAPRIARRWKPGQFVILRPAPASERIPLTIVEGSPEEGTITLVVQIAGKTTAVTAHLEPGQSLADLVGPLGEPATVARFGSVLCVGGGVGVAEVLPIARGLRAAGNRVAVLCGARSAAQIILAAELREAVDEVAWATDDGSAGFSGTVAGLMRQWRGERPARLDAVFCIGPVPMMQAVAELTRLWAVPTFASLNPIMVDGTGMCGGCRVTVGGQVRFACVEGPEFDAHQVDFNELAARNRAYLELERRAFERHRCRLGLGC